MNRKGFESTARGIGPAWGAAFALLLLAAGAAGAAESGAWIGAWAAPPLPLFGRPAAPRFVGQTLRQVVRLSAGGGQLRIRLSNEYGAAPMLIGAVHVALAGADGTVLADTDRTVTFAGQGAATIAPGAPLLSDPVALNVPALARVAVSLYLPAGAGACSCHEVALDTGYVSEVGDFTGAASLPVRASFGYRAWLAGVDVLPQSPGRTIVAFGDSLTDGVGASNDLDRRWPDRLAERLAARDGARRAWGMVNAGIGGNRLISDGDIGGQNAQARFDRDVLSVPGAAYLILFEGVNDLGAALPPPTPSVPPPLTATDLIAADRQLIARAHLAGLKVYGATLVPYGGAFYYSPAGEAERQKVNAWIRTGGAFDEVIDFDAAWRDPADPTRIRAEFDVGDHLHANDAGYRALGDAIDLNLFR